MPDKSTPSVTTGGNDGQESRYPPRTCRHCGAPITSRDGRARYCSRACVHTSNQAKLAALRAQGQDPGHGGAAADARRASLARRRAAGELLGRAAQKARRTADRAGPRSPENDATAIAVGPDEEPIFAKPMSPGPVYQAPPRHLTVAPYTVEQAGRMYQESGAAWERRAARQLGMESRKPGRTLVLAGYGAGLHVEHGALIAREGRTHDPQEPAVHELHRGVHGVGRIVCLGWSGAFSFDAVRWCVDQGVAVSLVDEDGRHLSTLTPEHAADIALRRAQYGLDDTHRAAIARRLIGRKLEGQRDTLERHPELPRASEAVTHLGHCLAWLDLPTVPSWLHDLGTLRTFEGRAAATYFAAWAGYPLTWRKGDARRVPPHWLTIRGRGSLIGSTNRHAVDPANACLNYAYGVLEGQCRQALVVEGLDVACGILHADKVGRDSLVFDLMELYRPIVDDRVLTFLGRTTFSYGDVVMQSDGQCRLHPQLARAVVAECRVEHRRLNKGAMALRALVERGHACIDTGIAGNV